LGGPFMNLIIALVITAILVTSVGVATPTTKVSDVFECMTETTDAAGLDAECEPDDQPSPAWEAGLRTGDVITEFNHQPVADWDELSSIINDVQIPKLPSRICATVKSTKHKSHRYVLNGPYWTVSINQ